VALSTVETEYIALSMAVHKEVWLCIAPCRFIRTCVGFIVIHCDNYSRVKLSKNSLFHDKLKHIEIKYHYKRDIVQRNAVLVQYLPKDEKVVDVLTKHLTKM
jgi:hypothetical protein